MPTAVEFGDIQGLARFGHAHMTEACFFLLRVGDRAAARTWLASAPITSAAPADSLPSRALQVAFTADGLRALGLAETVMAHFSSEFLVGMAGEESRSRRLGDIGVSAPPQWDWGYGERVPHICVLLYATAGGLAAWTEQIKGPHWAAAFRELGCLPTTDMKGVEPFGFVDGISQPALDWQRQLNASGDAEFNYRNLLMLGEFLLGYPNEYGQYTDRPLLDPKDDPDVTILPEAEDVPGRRDLGRNGTYLVLRQLRQDVRGFWQFLDRQARSNPEHARELAASMVGRVLDGEPLVPASDHPISGIADDAESVRRNRFTYDEDPGGIRCPFGAHIRRANPRNPDLPGGARSEIARLVHVLGFGRKGIRDDLLAASRFHRILRRGREYGVFLPPDQALMGGGAAGEESGLQFICLTGSISRQFEFVQNAWIMDSKFNGLSGESDALLGNRQPISGGISTNEFSRPRPGGPPERISDLPQFVTVRGGAYFFLPSLSGVRYLANLASRI